ncbi:MAG: aldo/keto reductase [Planctomycetes bacterium]|nr:aldo/keto reductase [Planctomycetota bacterium]
MATLAWGILGTGTIAKTFAKGLAGSKSGKLVAVGSRSRATADAFAQQFAGIRAHATYEALLTDRDVQAVYISLPHTLHAEWTIKAAEAGKHILCEKPLGVNHAEAMAMVEAAHRHDVFLMEAFMYRCHPQTAKLVELVASKAIGEIRLIHAPFAFSCDPAAEHRLVNNALAGGGILDVGCYTTSLARLIAGAATGKPFAEPIEVKGLGIIGPTRVDDYTAAVLSFPGGILAEIVTGVKLPHDNVVRIYGTAGSITVPSPWIPSREGGTTTITVARHDRKEPEQIAITTSTWLYALEADTVAEHVAKRQSPTMSWDDSLGNMRTLDRWREAIGLVYDLEKPENAKRTVHGRPLSAATPTQMRYGRIRGVDKPVSRLVMGVDNQNTMPHAAAMFDDFFERGGNCFDTAHVYGPVREKLLGQWVANRGVREQVAIIVKGAHTPNCNPKDLDAQLERSLGHLQTAYADIYMMHRDNLDIPVSEFVDCLNRHITAGRVRAYGGSNWSVERVDQANAYAAAKGLIGFSVLSNNFSLARMVEAPWGGCIAASDPASRTWLSTHDVALLSWSSQARGFFTERAHPSIRSDEELVRCWYSDDNFERKRRVEELARTLGVLPINVALAYVLCQPFATYALIGPRLLSETRTTWPALGIELTPGQVRWLNLEIERAP